MLIEYASSVINLKNVIGFDKPKANPLQIYFVTCHEHQPIILRFNTSEERDRSYEKIIESYRWERRHVNLNEV